LARHRDAVCRLCRREAQKLFLKGLRCFTEKCAIEKRNFVPGQHGQSRRAKVAGYGLQLREKQKVKRIYGVLENQFRSYFERAVRQKGVTGENLLAQLERRLDNVLVRIGFAVNHAQARQYVRHGHVIVNGKKVNIPSFQVSVGDEVSVKEKMKKNVQLASALELVGGRGTPHWLELNAENVTGKVLSLPKREDISLPIQERMIVELYSK
jgi:small subunit ribosomal protein S4